MSNSDGSRGKKILSLIGLRLEKIGNNPEESQWRVCNPVGTELNGEASINYDISSLQPPDASEQPLVMDYWEDGQTVEEMPVFAVDTLSEERQLQVSTPISYIANLHSEGSGFECEENLQNRGVPEDRPLSKTSESRESFSDCSCSDKDPDYNGDSSSLDSSSSEAEANEENEIVAEKEMKKTRKRKAKPTEWKKARAKKLRNSGKSYKTLGKGQDMPERVLKPACNESCSQKCSRKFSEEERMTIFNSYWEMADIVKQRVYISTMIKEINPKYRYTRSLNGRTTNHAFYFIKDDSKVRVCKKFFVATLGITNRCIRTVKTKIKEGSLAADNRGKHANHREVSADIKNGVRAHISSIPTIESHYTRSHSEKVYIEGSKTIAQLYRDYKSDCEAEGKPYANLTMYRNIFNYEFNIAFFSPKKDQCQTCVAYENSNENEKKALELEYNLHIEEKNLSRQDKERDKGKISPIFHVACYDLQASLLTPNGNVSTLYYKSKLSTYNFTVCDLTQKGQGSVNCYMWHEAEGKRGAIEIGTCLLKYLKEKAEAANSTELEIILYSDNCAGQQKNKFIIAAFLYAVANYNIKSITQKYLITGHTQNEGDNVHSLVEKNIKRALKSGPISIPSQYVSIVQTARKTGQPFKVVELAHEDFVDLKDLTEQTCNNFVKNSLGENFRISDVAVIRVERDSLDCFYYKSSFKENDYKMVKVTTAKRTRQQSNLTTLSKFDLKNAYSSTIPITKKKYDGFMFLIRTKGIGSSYRQFYENLKFE